MKDPFKNDEPDELQDDAMREASQGEETPDAHKAAVPLAAPAAMPGTEEKKPLVSRRSFVLGIGGVAVLGGIGAVRYVAPHAPLVRPPGGQDEERLVSACIRCQKCYEICPRDVIRPAHIEDGVVTMQTPTFDFSRSFCDWCEEGNGGVPLCVSVCPTLALELPAGATPENTILGKAALNKDWCLAYKLIGCRFCYDACPYEAMGLDDNGRPYVIDDSCNGCGACESVCVSLQNGSISAGAIDRAIVIHPLDEQGNIVYPAYFGRKEATNG